MLEQFLSFAPSCRPLNVAETDNDVGFRVGGQPPEGVDPLSPNEHTRSFVTIPLTADRRYELSAFTSLSGDPTSPAFLTNSMFVFHTEDSYLVQFVVHERAKRAKRSPLTAAFDGHGLRLEDERTDSADPEKDELWTHHK